MSMRNLVLFAAVAALISLICPASDGSPIATSAAALAADTLVGATLIPPPRKPVTKVDPVYFCKVTDCDGSESIDEMTDDQITNARKDQFDKRKEANKAWNEQKDKWVKVFGQKPFPLLPPKPSQVAKLGRVPLADKAKESALEKLNRQLEVWDVCIVKIPAGTKTAESIRHDKVYAKQQQLQKEYIDALLAAVEAKKENPDAKKDAPDKPEVVVFKERIASADDAGKLVEKLTEKLNKDAEKKDAEKAKDAEKKAAEAEKKP